ncbi:MAG: tRNA dihydrouridine(20/20a) synthase DusA [Pseudomonadota bacterium]
MNRPKVAVAPMMDWTDRHCRYFMRQINGAVWLYTEMVTAAALLHGDAERLLRYDPTEHPVALQLGGSDPAMMAKAARLGSDAGYDEININVGCPSERVQSGAFGACLMAEPMLVAECVDRMQAASSVPVTVKTRIGIDDQDSVEFLYAFVDAIQSAGCKTLIVHARKAFLQGLSPKENRTVPPLDYPRVYGLKRDYPALTVILNGGITTRTACDEHLKQVDGVMIGRQAYQQPWLLAELAELEGAGDSPCRTRHDVVAAMLPYIEKELARGALLKHITRHMLGLFAGQPGARAWRRTLSEQAHRSGVDSNLLEDALAQLPAAA